MATIGNGRVFNDSGVKVFRILNWKMRLAGNTGNGQLSTTVNPTGTFFTNSGPQEISASISVGSSASGQSVGSKSILIRASGTGDDIYDPAAAMIDAVRQADEEPSKEDVRLITGHHDAATELAILESSARFEPHWSELRQTETPVTSLAQLGLEDYEIGLTINRMQRFSILVGINGPHIVIAAELRLILQGMGVSTMGISEDDSLFALVENEAVEAPYLDYAYGLFHRTTGLPIRFSQLAELDAATKQFFADLEGDF